MIIKLSALGDIVQALPVLHAIKGTWPFCRVDWITSEVGAELLAGHSLLDRVIVYPRQALGRMARHPLRWPELLRKLGKLSAQLKEARYDAALDLQGLFKSGMIAYLSGAVHKLGFAGTREASSLFLNRKLPPYDPDQHAVLRYLKIPEYMGADIRGEIGFPLEITGHDFLEARRLLAELGVNEKEYVLLVPGTIWPSKHWTIQGFSTLAGLISRELGLASLTVGSRADNALGRAIEQASSGSARDITGRTSVKMLAALSSLAATAVTTDTGPMHLASAAGLKLVALFGPTAPWRTGPFGKGHVVLRKAVECSPCFRRKCNDRRCMLSISPEEVLTAVKRVLETGLE